MQLIQNRASLPTFLAAFTVIFCLGFGIDAQASATHQKSVSKKTVTVTHKKTAAVSRHTKKTARKPAAKVKIAQRQRLSALNGASGKSSRVRVALRQSQPEDIIIHRNTEPDVQSGPHAALLSEVAFVQDLQSSAVLYDKNSDEARPIASISKLMTALIIAESGLPMNQTLRISDDDVDRLRHSRSRLPVGTELSRADMLHLALMSSENRAAHALARYYPGGMPAFIRAMNDKARSLGMRKTHFVEPTGLSVENVSSPRDLVKLLRVVSKQPLIHRYTTDDTYEIELNNGRQLVYNNTNRLVKNSSWNIKISKTGFINEAGECLVMVTRIDNRDVAIVLLNSTGSYSRIGDAVRVRNYVEKSSNLAML